MHSLHYTKPIHYSLEQCDVLYWTYSMFIFTFIKDNHHCHCWLGSVISSVQTFEVEPSISSDTGICQSLIFLQSSLWIYILHNLNFYSFTEEISWSGNAYNLYLRGIHYESWPWYRLFWQSFCGFPQSLQ
jgi:hypothetical protein